MTAASDAMGDRLRPLLMKYPLVEKKMFGGLGFMLNGNMLIGTTAKGELLVRVDPGKTDQALSKAGAHRMHMGPKVMTGFIAVDETGTIGAKALTDWISFSYAYVTGLPPK